MNSQMALLKTSVSFHQHQQCSAPRALAMEVGTHFLLAITRRSLGTGEEDR